MFNNTSNFGRPIMDGNTALGASSLANPALQTPEPLSMTSAVMSLPRMLSVGIVQTFYPLVYWYGLDTPLGSYFLICRRPYKPLVCWNCRNTSDRFSAGVVGAFQSSGLRLVYVFPIQLQFGAFKSLNMSQLFLIAKLPLIITCMYMLAAQGRIQWAHQQKLILYACCEYLIIRKYCLSHICLLIDRLSTWCDNNDIWTIFKTVLEQAEAQQIIFTNYFQ